MHLYVPKIDLNRYSIKDDQKMILDLLLQEKYYSYKVLPLTGHADHFRIVTLPREDDLDMAIQKLVALLSVIINKITCI